MSKTEWTKKIIIIVIGSIIAAYGITLALYAVKWSTVYSSV